MTKTLGEYIGALSDEVAEEVGFEAQPKPFEGIEIGAVARQVMHLEVVPLSLWDLCQLALSTMRSRRLESTAGISWAK